MKKEEPSLDILKAFDRLEVGPPRLDQRRVIAPYKVVQDQREEVFELEYSFEENVFEPEDPANQNLAAMMTAQVALNYGLFCDQLIFHGPFDSHDRQFLQNMAANTAREIYVVKFLRPNPFLQGLAARLEPQKLDSYLRAELVFPNPEPAIGKISDTWPGSPARHAVLSSGGKDSLLSFGLLNEMGYDTHPLFVNESGRHWFTALNAYRYFSVNYPRTARTWTNCDRLFSWMLRRLPFVRQDFANVRSDEYPIRLWTVAVFLFGVLPLVRKRGIDRLVIGDEYDTTVRSSYNGITHYNGLYDQSRFFDEALTRYFMRKGWRISQFSLVRSLSEILIEKILAKRYPKLLRQQTSCHATHNDGERVRPCGKCEKCRRIVGMLLAIEVDPVNLGYSRSQIDACIAALADQTIHQESAGAAHLLSLLKAQGRLPAGSKMARRARSHPEIMKIRINPERSPIEALPLDLRQPLFRIFMKYAEGTVQRRGRQWAEFDLLRDPQLRRPYIFESSTLQQIATKSDGRPDAKKEYVLGELTWPDAKKRFSEVDVALLPVGAIEQHGPHLPLDTDAFDAEYLALQVAANCSDPKPLVLPLVPYGVSYHHEDFPGTLSVTNETLARFVYEIGMGAARNGITKLIIINGHGGNASTLQFAAQMINRDAHIFTCVDTGETSDTDINLLTETDSDVHAGEIETSTTLAIRPHLVDMKKAGKFVTYFSSRYLNFSSKHRVEWNARTAKVSETGVMGDPSKASKEKGERFWQIMVANLVEFVEQLKSMTLDEIHQRRY